MTAGEDAPLAAFVRCMLDGGRPRVGPPPLLAPPRPGEIDAALALLYERARQGLAHEAPPFDPTSARWGAWALYRAAQAVLFRQADDPSPAERAPADALLTPAGAFGADLALRHLPVLARAARAAKSRSGAIALLGRIAPLSSVGIHDLEPCPPARLAPILASPALLALYVDRIVATEDTSRLGAAPQVDRAVRDAIGDHDELAPALARILGAGRA